MRLIHFSDTHLGFSDYYRSDPESGLNLRERDFYQAWDQVVQAILTLQPDLVLHAGDLFHTPRPNNRAIRIALEGIQKISAAGIPLVLVSGNHETPRIRSTGSIFESIALFPGVYPVFESRYECKRIGAVAVHCLPHCSLSEELEAALLNIQQPVTADYQVLLTHGAWSSGDFGMGEFNEQRLPDLEAMTGRSFDYIALGHYHKQVTIREHICYSGSTERTSLSQSENPCGFLEVDLASREKRFHPLETRPIIRLPIIDCSDYSAQDIYRQVETLSQTCPAGAIVQLTLAQVSESVFLQLEVRKIEALFNQTLHLEKKIRLSTAKAGTEKMAERIESLPIEFGRYLEQADEPVWDKKRLLQLGQHYLNL